MSTPVFMSTWIFVHVFLTFCMLSMQIPVYFFCTHVSMHKLWICASILLCFCVCVCVFVRGEQIVYESVTHLSYPTTICCDLLEQLLCNQMTMSCIQQCSIPRISAIPYETFSGSCFRLIIHHDFCAVIFVKGFKSLNKPCKGDDTSMGSNKFNYFLSMPA